MKIIKNIKEKYNDMTNTNNKNEKIFILEWESAELKDGTMRYEKFKVITGNNKESLNFYTTFFTGNTKFKKGEFYQLSTPGNFVQDSSEIIQGIDNGGYEFEKVYPSLMIKELWEEKIKNTGKIDVLEADLEKRKQEVNRINRELSDKKIELNNLQSKFNNLQTEKTNGDEKISSLERSIQEKDKKIQETDQKSKNLETEKKQLQDRFTNLQEEKEKVENKFECKQLTKMDSCCISLTYILELIGWLII